MPTGPVDDAFRPQAESPALDTAHWLSVTLFSIGDGVIATDAAARISFMNPVAEQLTGWTMAEAAGVELETVFRIVNQETGEKAESPVTKALREGRIVGLANHTVLIARDDTERPIDDSAAPIRDESGEVAGVVLVFRDITERYQHEQSIREALDHASNIVATLREPFLILDDALRVISANRQFYQSFRTIPETTEGRLVYQLGDGQWDIPALRRALTEVLTNDHSVLDFEVRHRFPGLGQKCMVLNAQRVRKPGEQSELILLAIEDVTERRRAVTLIEQEARLSALIARGEPTTRCLEALCLAIELIDPEVRACILRTNRTGTRFSSVIAPRFPELTTWLTSAPIADGKLGSYAAAIVRDGPVIVTDVATATEWDAAWREACLKASIRAALFVPVAVLGPRAEASVMLCFDVAKEPTIADRQIANMADRTVANLLRRDALQATEQGRQLALDSAELGSWHLDQSSMDLITDARFQSIFGHTDGDLTYNRGIADIHPADRARVMAAVEAALRPDDPEPYACEYRVVHADGSIRWVFAKGRLNVGGDDDNSTPATLDGTIADVTERVETSRRLLVSEQRYRRLFESARDGILILDAASMRIEDANPYMCELLGYSLDEFVGKELWEIGILPDKAASQVAVEILSRTGYLRYEDLPLQTTAGEQCEVEFICNIYSEGEREVAQCNIRNITERRTLDRQLEEQAKSLADMNRRKDEFLAMLSHELRNPMAPILNALTLLEQENQRNALQREAQDIIGRQIRHLARLTEDLLEISRVTTGHIALRRERADLRGIVGHALERIQSTAERRSQTVTLSLPETPVWVNADVTRLEQVVGNLLSNASKYTGSDGQIVLSVEVQDLQATLRVRDNGVGITAEMLPHVFELFSQADRSLDRADGGLGIGLALVESLIELHGGTVTALSEGIGHGSEFVLRLPMRPAPSEPDALPTAPTPSMQGHARRILVVEDNTDAARMLALLLESWGQTVAVAHDGPEALVRARTFKPELVLLDIGLPGMDGYAVARRIRALPGLGDVRVAAITGYGQESDRQLSLAAGFDAHLVKPVDIDLLAALLNSEARPAA
ncbi:MAG: PAS domain S-box protein [Gemmatimonadota bacterium]